MTVFPVGECWGCSPALFVNHLAAVYINHHVVVVHATERECGVGVVIGQVERANKVETVVLTIPMAIIVQTIGWATTVIWAGNGHEHLVPLW